MRRGLFIAGLALLALAALALSMSSMMLHRASSISATEVCLEILNKVSEQGLNRSLIINTVSGYVSKYDLSIEVTVYNPSGLVLWRYGSYFPNPTTYMAPGYVGISSSRVSVIAYGVCEYLGEEYMVEVKVGISPLSVILFITGIVLVILGLALVALSSGGRSQKQAT